MDKEKINKIISEHKGDSPNPYEAVVLRTLPVQSTARYEGQVEITPDIIEYTKTTFKSRKKRLVIEKSELVYAKIAEGNTNNLSIKTVSGDAYIIIKK